MCKNVSCNDLFIFFVVTFAIVNIIIDWNSFDNCKKPIHIWLMVALVGIILHRLASIFFFDEEEDYNRDADILRINFFRRGYKIYTFIAVGVVYPLFFFWTLLGTVWYIEDTIDESTKSSPKSDLISKVSAESSKSPPVPACFTDQNTTNWYFLAWIITFYAMIIIFTTTIMYAGIVSYRNYIFEQQFSSLLLQYDTLERPDMNFNLNGLSPMQIAGLPVQAASEEDGTCPVCIETFQPNEKARVLPCSHKYHLLCIDRWLMQHTSCPLCKAEINAK